MPTPSQRPSCRDERAFTLIELLIVLVVIGILIAVAVPSYLSFKDRSSDTAAKANLSNARPAVAAFFAENHGAAGDADLNPGTSGYEGMTIAILQAIDSSISTSTLEIDTVSSSDFCLSSTHDGHVWNQAGPSAPVAQGACP